MALHPLLQQYRIPSRLEEMNATDYYAIQKLPSHADWATWLPAKSPLRFIAFLASLIFIWALILFIKFQFY
jgi:hypothetical protein